MTHALLGALLLSLTFEEELQHMARSQIGNQIVKGAMELTGVQASWPCHRW